MNTSLETFIQKIRRLDQKDVFFVAGTEKSGTTWLQMLLDHHPQARCRGEGQIATRLWPELRKALDEYSAFVGGLNKSVFSEIEHFPSFTEESVRAIQAFSAMALLSEYGDDPALLAVGEKTPGHLRRLDRLKLLFPAAKFIFICRDGRDIAVSGWYHLKRQYGETRADPLPAYAKRIATVWRQDYQKAVDFTRRYPADCVQLRYEDLHRDPVPELTRVLEFLGLDASAEVVNDCLAACAFDALSGGRERGQENAGSHFRKGIVGDWRNHFDAETLAIFDAEAGDLLSTLGYEREVRAEAAPSPEVVPAPSRRVSISVGKPAAPAATPPSPGRVLPEADPLSRARELSRAGNWRAAADVLLSAIAEGGESFEAWYLLGKARRVLRDSSGAAEAYAKAAAADESHQDAMFMTAVALQEAGQTDEALAAYARLLKTWPNFAQGWSVYGMALNAAQRHDEAVAAFRASLAIAEDIPTHNALVMTLETSGQRELALEEGARVLDYKDRKACDAFVRGPHRQLSLDVPPRQFDHTKPHRNIIAFSLWGEDPVYVHGAIVNARIAPNLYYGWTTRFYCDESVPADAIEELKRCGAQVVMMEDPKLRPLRPLWRFLVSDDPDVDRFICRDADSRLNAQELLAVEEWINSGKAFHVMRDHVFHIDLILAGMWGGTAGVLPKMSDAILNEGVYTKNRFGDQVFLKDFVWPLIKDHVLIHDGYYRLHGAKEFPAAYRLPRPIHVGGAMKSMPSWRTGK